MYHPFNLYVSITHVSTLKFACLYNIVVMLQIEYHLSLEHFVFFVRVIETDQIDHPLCVYNIFVVHVRERLHRVCMSL